jgi:hypothetical protein
MTKKRFFLGLVLGLVLALALAASAMAAGTLEYKGAAQGNATLSGPGELTFSITVSNANRNPVFKELFEALSKYKRVNSGGRWMNNVGGPVADKMTFDRRHKFSIACENSASPGYTTEKLVQAFAAKTIPIYWGDPLVSRVFNTKAFINVNDFASVD